MFLQHFWLLPVFFLWLVFGLYESLWEVEPAVSQWQKHIWHLWQSPSDPGRIRTILLWTGGLWRAQAGQLLWGFWVDDGGVSPLQVLRDAHHVTVAIVQLPLGEEVLELWSAIDVLDWRGGRERKKRDSEWGGQWRKRGRNKLDSFLPLRNVLQEDIGNILVEMRWGQPP